jgi:hypothetical protein
MFRLLLSHHEALEKYFGKERCEATYAISLEHWRLSFVSITSQNVLQKFHSFMRAEIILKNQN